MFNLSLLKVFSSMLSLVVGVFLFILPIVNHVGIFIAIRRRNNNVAGAVSGQDLSALVRREKKVAIDMIIVIGILLFSLFPAVIVNMFRPFLGDKFEALYVWATSVIYFNSSINPDIYFVRRSEIRSAIRSMIHTYIWYILHACLELKYIKIFHNFSPSGFNKTFTNTVKNVFWLLIVLIETFFYIYLLDTLQLFS